MSCQLRLLSMLMALKEYLKNKDFIIVIMQISQVISSGKRMLSLSINLVSIIRMRSEINIWISDINGMRR